MCSKFRSPKLIRLLFLLDRKCALVLPFASLSSSSVASRVCRAQCTSRLVTHLSSVWLCRQSKTDRSVNPGHPPAAHWDRPLPPANGTKFASLDGSWHFVPEYRTQQQPCLGTGLCPIVALTMRNSSRKGAIQTELLWSIVLAASDYLAHQVPLPLCYWSCYLLSTLVFYV